MQHSGVKNNEERCIHSGANSKLNKIAEAQSGYTRFGLQPAEVAHEADLQDESCGPPPPPGCGPPVAARPIPHKKKLRPRNDDTYRKASSLQLTIVDEGIASKFDPGGIGSPQPRNDVITEKRPCNCRLWSR